MHLLELTSQKYEPAARPWRPVFAVAAAIALGFVTLFAFPFNDESTWRSNVLAGALVAIVWMGTGAAISRAEPKACLLLLLLGAFVCRFLSYGIVFGTSPYYELLTYTTATLAGGIAWAILAKRFNRELRLPIAVTAIFLLLQAWRTASTAMPAVAVPAHHGEDSELVSHFSGGDTSYVGYLWQPANGRIGKHADTVTVRADLEASGASPHLLARVSDATDRARLCIRLQNEHGKLVDAEIAGGSTPSFVTAIPLVRYNCEAGTFWRIVN
jgi:hypothetical protein